MNNPNFIFHSSFGREVGEQLYDVLPKDVVNNLIYDWFESQLYEDALLALIQHNKDIFSYKAKLDYKCHTIKEILTISLQKPTYLTKNKWRLRIKNSNWGICIHDLELSELIDCIKNEKIDFPEGYHIKDNLYIKHLKSELYNLANTNN